MIRYIRMKMLFGMHSDKFKNTIYFITQKGELELQSVLLVTSLKKWVKDNTRLVACIPTIDGIDLQPSVDTLNNLESMGCEIDFVNNPIGREYLNANKIGCFDLNYVSENHIFLDSDIICFNDFDRSEFTRGKINVKPADIYFFGNEKSLWNELYKIGGISKGNYTKSSSSGHMMPSYFNAGVISIKETLKNKFVKEFKRLIVNIEENNKITQKRPWLDQLALAVIVEKLDSNYNILNETYNFPLNLKNIGSKNPVFVHYHLPVHILESIRMLNFVGELAVENPYILKLAEKNLNWEEVFVNYKYKRNFLNRKSEKIVLNSKQIHKVLNAKNVVITGVPRSGTSYLTSLIHNVLNVVALNESIKFSHPLIHECGGNYLIDTIAKYYNRNRIRTLKGLHLENKIKNDEVVSDTRFSNELSYYFPEVNSEDFLLFVKNPIGFLSRIEPLYKKLNYKVVVCVRDPYSTIASWKSLKNNKIFSHLSNAEVEKFVLGGTTDPYLNEFSKKRLNDIFINPSIEYKRALMWQHFAKQVIDNQNIIHLVKYEDLCENPQGVVEVLLKWVDPKFKIKWKKIPHKSDVKSKTNVLSKQDNKAIKLVCYQTASELGYEV